MKKDWRTAVCKKPRWRIIIYMSIAIWISSFIGSFAINTLWGNKLIRKRAQLTVGMTRQEIIEIIGQPDRINHQTTALLAGGAFTGDLGEAIKNYQTIPEYLYSTPKVPGWPQKWIGMIFLDGKEARILLLSKKPYPFLDYGDQHYGAHYPYHVLPFFISWFVISLICKLRSRKSHPESQDQQARQHPL